MKLSKRTIALIILTLTAVGGAYYYYFYPKDTNYIESSEGGNWLYRKSITIPNTEGTFLNKEIKIEIDTATLISAGKLQNDCDDLRFVDNDGTSYLPYWVAGGCNSTSTSIGIVIPNLPKDGKTIYMYYGNDTAINFEDTSHSTTLNKNI